jgi:hypothetical protein
MAQANSRWCTVALALALAGTCGPGEAQDAAPAERVTIRLKDGSRLIGAVVARDDTRLEIVTRDGAR